MKNYYAKQEIYRIMNWITKEMNGDNIMENKDKFKWLEHYFKKWIKSLEK